MNLPTLPLLTSIVIAMCLHIAIAIALKSWEFPIDQAETKTTTFKLLSSETRQSIATQTSQSASSSAAASNKIVTRGKSAYSTAVSEHNTQDANAKRGSNSGDSSTQTPDVPTLPTTVSTQSSRASKTSQGLRDIFAQQKLPTPSDLKQITTTDSPKLSAYEQMLWEKIAGSRRIFDDFHKVVNTNVDYKVSITLFPNGQIKRAVISESSGIQEIDDLAIQATYNASPFPKPPIEDMARGFKYTVSVSYQNE